MLKLFLCLLLSSTVLAFTNVALKNNVRACSLSLQAAKSKALPFLNRPANLDGSMVGDFGFDPLGFTDTLNDLSYVQSAEIKHGRVAMLATVGFLFQQYVHIVSAESNPLKAVSSLGVGPNLQLLLGIGVLELATWNKTYNGEKPGMCKY